MDQQKTRRKRKKNMFWPVLIGVCLLIYIIMQWYLINRNKIETVKATEGFINDSIMSVGIVCRDEIIMQDASAGYYYYAVENGDRVSSGMLVGEVYPTSEDINLIYQSQDIDKQIANLEEAENFMSSVNVDISITRRQLSNCMVEFSRNLSRGIYSNSYNDMSDIALQINKINVAMNREGDMESTKQALVDLNNSVKNQISQPVQTIYSSVSGYFTNTTDGYENIASVENFENISYAEGADILMNSIEQTDSNVYGKIITDYKWNLCTYVTSLQAEKLYEGQKIRLSIDVEEQTYQYVTVDKIVPKDNDMVLVVLKASTIGKDAVSARIRESEILFSQYKGIKIPKSAIRIVDGEMGVYVKFSKLVQFKKIKPVYQDENYIILPIENDAENQVELYDDIIVKGVNLYDGKYL
ncbi:MAG: hypothetical protein E7484_01060 [Ruminococcaceae bacterium]|nr:hypothetical protein [Oscillospiraceae bacterium]